MSTLNKDEEIAINIYVEKLHNMVKYNRDKLINDEEYKNLSQEKRILHIQKHEDYKDFCTTFPIVSKYAIAYGLYSTKAFKRYIKYKFTKKPTKEEREELINNPYGQKLWSNHLYATYVKWLHADKKPHCPQNELDNVYKQTLDMLNKETKKFFDTYEKELEKFNKEKEKLNNERKEELKELFKQNLQKKLEKT